MDVDPLSVFFHVIRIAVFIFAIIFFAAAYSSMKSQINVNDMERYTVELNDLISSSNLTNSKYIFSPDRMNEQKDKNFTEIQSCSYAYKFFIEDSVTGKKWEFGEEPSTLDTYKTINRKFDISVNDAGSIHPGTITIITYDYLVGRLSCVIQRAVSMHEIQNLTFACSRLTQIDRTPVCLSFRRVGDYGCSFVSDVAGSRNVDCKYLPVSSFNEIYETQQSMEEEGIDTKKPFNLIAYPLRTNAECIDVQRASELYTAGRDDKVISVLLCIENLR